MARPRVVRRCIECAILTGMAQAYPPIEPYDHGLLDVGDGHRVYWETCGNPKGKPAVVLHGGPGSGCSIGNRRAFNPAAYRIVLFDQRACGRSTPHASGTIAPLAVGGLPLAVSEPGAPWTAVPAANSQPLTAIGPKGAPGSPTANRQPLPANGAMSANTTEHLLGDIELLREHLGIKRWLVFGGSWGSTIALAYAERHPARVSELILAAVTNTTRWEVDWITEGVGQYFPEALAHFRAGIPDAMPGERLVDAYHRLLMSSDPAVHNKAARDWCDWEMAIVAVRPDHKPSPRYEQADFRLAFARLVTHYFRHDAWIEDGRLLREGHRLAGIPGVMIHGRLDLGCPLITPWRLAQAWPGSELIIVNEAGHDARDPGMTETLVDATDRFAVS